MRTHGANASGEGWFGTGAALDEFLRILEKYLDHPGMTRIRGYEHRILAFLDWLVERSGAAPGPAAGHRAAAVRAELARRSDVYEPARVREHRVSIAVPMTSRPAALVSAIDTIAAQTFTNWEILVVDQGVIPVRELLRGHRVWDRISCVRLPVQRTAGAARNVALRMARGEYVTFLDEDNTIAPDHLETLVGTIERSGGDVAVAAARLLVDRAGLFGVVHQPIAVAEGLFRGAADPAWLGGVANALPLNAVLHHRRFAERAGPFNEDVVILEDFDYLMRLQSTSRFVFTGATTLDVHARLRFESQVLGTNASRYLVTLDSLYAARGVAPEVDGLRAAHRAAVADVLGRRAELGATPAGVVEFMLALAGRTVAPQPVAEPAT